MAREYFCAYHSYLDWLESLGDAERGRLFTACLEYSMTGVDQDIRGNEKVIWPAIRRQIDRDMERYQAKCNTNRANGALGGQANGKRSLPNAPRTGSERPPRGKGEGERENGEEKRENENTPIAPKGAGRFDEFWSAYPKKVGKDAARKAFQKRKPDADTLAAMLAAIARQRASQQWTKDGGQYIPNPATWLNQGRWQDELPSTETFTDFGFRDVRGDLYG